MRLHAVLCLCHHLRCESYSLSYGAGSDLLRSPAPSFCGWLMNFPVRNFPASFRLDRPEAIPSSLEDTDDSTRKTVQAMCRHIAKAQTDPWFLAIAHNITRSREFADMVSAVFLYCKAAIKFQRDEESVWNLYRKLNAIDFLIEPRALARMLPKAYGDCDEFTMFSLACLKALGVDSEIVTVAVDPERPGYWSHVYGQVILPDGRRMALDCSPAGRFPGWEVPDRDVQRKQAWALDGSPSYAAPAAKDLGLHAYIPRRVAKRGRRGMRGLGDQIGSGEFSGAPETSGATDPSWFERNFDSPLTVDPVTGATSGGGFNWNNLINSLGSIGTKLGTIALTPKGGVVQTDSKGNVIVSNTGLPVSFSSLASGGGGSLLLWGGLAVGLVLILSVAKK